MLKIYFIEVKRSPLLIALPVLIAIDLAVLFGRSRHWIGVWPEASAATQVVTLFLGPLLAAVSSWQAGRSSRASMPDFLLSAARSGWKIEAARLAATLTMGLVAYGIGALVAAMASISEAGDGFLWPSYLALGAGTLTLFAAVGHLAGRWWPSPLFTPVVCALGGFISLLAIGQNYGMFVLSGPPDEEVRFGPLALRLLLAVGAAIAAITLPDVPGKRRDALQRPLPTASRVAGTIAVISCLGLLALIPTAGSLRGERDPSQFKALCEQAEKSGPRVCVWPEHRKYLGELREMAERLDAIPQKWVRTPDTFYEEGLRPTRLGDMGFSITEGHVRSAAIAMAGQVSMMSFHGCLPPERDTRAWQASNRVDIWLEYRAMGVDPEIADKGLTITGVTDAQKDAAHIARLSESEQSESISRQRDYLRESGCGT